jgi:hypothetical protein
MMACLMSYLMDTTWISYVRLLDVHQI